VVVAHGPTRGRDGVLASGGLAGGPSSGSGPAPAPSKGKHKCVNLDNDEVSSDEDELLQKRL
jgi:hypothetical protein